jgi:hypothetical protein
MSPRVKTITETLRRLEPVTADPFIDGLEPECAAPPAGPPTRPPVRPGQPPAPR